MVQQTVNNNKHAAIISEVAGLISAMAFDPKYSAPFQSRELSEKTSMLTNKEIHTAAIKAFEDIISYAPYEYGIFKGSGVAVESAVKIAKRYGLKDEEIHKPAINGFISQVAENSFELATSIEKNFKLTTEEVHSAVIKAFEKRNCRW